MSDNNHTARFKIHGIYSFDTYAPDILGTRIANVKVLAIMDSQTAIKEGVDVLGLHERIRSYLPVGYLDDPLEMTYLKVKNTLGEETVFAIDWINIATLVENTSSKIKVTLNGVGYDDIAVIRKALSLTGYSDFKITLSEE